MKTDEATEYGCGGCFLVAICILFLILILSSCNQKCYDGYYAGQIERINHITVDGRKSMFLHTDKYIILTDYNKKIELDDSVFIYETLPLNFADPYRWVIIDGCKIPIR